MKISTFTLIKNNTQDLCTRINSVLQYFLMLQSEIIKMAKVPNLYLL